MPGSKRLLPLIACLLALALPLFAAPTAEASQQPAGQVAVDDIRLGDVEMLTVMPDGTAIEVSCFLTKPFAAIAKVHPLQRAAKAGSRLKEAVGKVREFKPLQAVRRGVRRATCRGGTCG